MKIEVFQHFAKKGWTTKTFPKMDSKKTVVFIFGNSTFYRSENKIFEELKNAYPQSQMIGCSSSGEIFKDKIFDDSLSVAIVQFEKTNVYSSALDIREFKNSFDIGKQIATNLNNPIDGKKLKGIFVLSDGQNVNGSELVRGINSNLPADIVVTGGLAGDGPRFKETWTVGDQRLLLNHVIGLGFYGEHIEFFHGSQGGWDKFGIERVVTRSQGNILYELDGEPALKLYKKYLGERSSELPAAALLFPLAIRENGKSYTRTVLSIDEENQSMIFAGDIPKGSTAQLMKANFDRLINGAGQAANSLTKVNPDRESLMLAISCVGRRLVLKDRCEEEVEAILEKMPSKTHQIGFYSYGEISPTVSGNSCDLHNQTMTLTLIQEK